MARCGVFLKHTTSEQEHGYVCNTSSYDVRYKFTGKERDSETGFDYTSTSSVHSFGARYYSSGLSVWLSIDPCRSVNQHLQYMPRQLL